MRAVAAFSNVDLITALLSCNRQFGLVMKLRDLKLVEEFAGPDGRLALPQRKRCCSASGLRVWWN